MELDRLLSECQAHLRHGQYMAEGILERGDAELGRLKDGFSGIVQCEPSGRWPIAMATAVMVKDGYNFGKIMGLIHKKCEGSMEKFLADPMRFRRMEQASGGDMCAAFAKPRGDE